MLLDELADVVDRARGLRAAHQEQVLAVAGDAVHRRSQARVVGHLGVRLALGHPGPEDLLADVLDLDRAGLVRQVGERRLHRDEPVEQVLLVVLEADVQDVGLAAGRDVARHLEGHRRLAGALGAADEQQLAGAQAGADRLVERREAERDRLVLGDVAGRDLVVEVDQDIERRTRPQAAVVGVECARSAWGRASAVGRARRERRCSRDRILPEWLRWRTVAPTVRPNHPSERTISAQAPAVARSARQIDQFVDTSGRSSGCPSRSCARSIHSLGAWALSSGGVKPRSTTGRPRIDVEAGADRDRAALADVDRRLPEGRLERPGGGLRRRMVHRRQARDARHRGSWTVVVTPGGATSST